MEVTHAYKLSPMPLPHFVFLKNKGAINHLYGSMDNIPDRMREQKPYLEEWSVTITVVMNMQQIVGNIV